MVQGLVRLDSRRHLQGQAQGYRQPQLQLQIHHRPHHQLTILHLE